MRIVNRSIAVTVGVAGMTAAAACGQSSFTLIEPFPGSESMSVTGVSANGSVVTGYSYGPNTSTTTAFTWTREGGRFDFGAGLPNRAVALGISGDGQTVVGMEGDTARIFRWTLAGGYQPITGMTGYQDTLALDINGDGSVIAGHARNGGGPTPPTGPGFRWTQAGGYQNLGALPGGSARVDVGGMSRDGSTIVGTSSQSAFGNLHAFRWTSSGGMQPLEPAVNSPFHETEGRGVSKNGLVAIGSGNVPGSAHPFRWTEATGLIDLGLPVEVVSPGVALHSNFDGSVISCSFNLDVDYLWLAGSGYVRFDTYLAQAGISLPIGASVIDVDGISDDGRTFVGGLTVPGLGRRGFVAVVPGPASTCILVVGFVVASRRRRR